jgi:hypothetical protein
MHGARFKQSVSSRFLRRHSRRRDWRVCRRLSHHDADGDTTLSRQCGKGNAAIYIGCTSSTHVSTSRILCEQRVGCAPKVNIRLFSSTVFLTLGALLTHGHVSPDCRYWYRFFCCCWRSSYNNSTCLDTYMAYRACCVRTLKTVTLPRFLLAGRKQVGPSTVVSNRDLTYNPLARAEVSCKALAFSAARFTVILNRW